MDPTAHPQHCSRGGFCYPMSLPPAKNVDAVTLIAELAGEVVVVDEVSLIKRGLIRVKMQTRDISRLKGFIEIFIKGVGYEIKFSLENTKKKASSDLTPPPKKQDDDSLREEDDDLYDTDEEPPQRSSSHDKHENTDGHREGGGTVGHQHAT